MDKDDVAYISNEYCSATRRKELLPFKKTWMDLEGIMLSKTNHRRKMSAIPSHLYVDSKKMELVERE